MLIFDAQKTAKALPRSALINTLREAFKQGCESPLRHHHTIKIQDEADASLLLMPAWQSGKYLGIKNVIVVPDNHKRGKPAVAASYLLYSAVSGELLAIIDGEELTRRRTGAASALASSYLSRTDSSHLLMIGSGGLIPHLIKSHCKVRPIDTVNIWARDSQKSKALAASLTIDGVKINAVQNLAVACSQADIISSATLSNTPLILGENTTPGTHIDLVGAFTPQMRESDDGLIKASSLFADTLEGVLSEGGDYVQPLADGVITRDNIIADLYALAREEHRGREIAQEITVFKSTGSALEDLAAGALAFEMFSE